MSTFQNPALQEFVSRLGNELAMAQVWIRRTTAGYELRHIEDRETKGESLRHLNMIEVRALAQHTAHSEFRPLKSAPTLQRGWLLKVADESKLEAALSRLYPGALADWYAAQAASPSVTNYREFVNRQSGMYRVTAKLSDGEAAQVILTACEPSRCLKRRLWTVSGLPPDGPAGKSLIPCLEPCAVLMELARKTFRNEQRDTADSEFKIAGEGELG